MQKKTQTLEIEKFLLYNANMENKYGNYIQNPLKETFNVKSIFTIHYFKYGKNFRVRTESHNFWELVYIDSGKAVITAGEKQFTLSQGQAYFHKPDEIHTIHTEDEFANSAIVSFECTSKAMKLFEDRAVTLNDFEKQLLNKIIFEGKLSFKDKLNDIYLVKMTKRDDAPFSGEQLIKNCIELLLISLARNILNENESEALEENLAINSPVKIVENILQILNDNLYNNIDLDTISKKLSFSKTYIKAIFKKHTGTTIIQHYISLKIAEAKKLLSQNKYTVTEIAFMLNFNSVHYFSRQFKDQTDMSPTEYANSIKADNVL